jgi:hypothetical protein
MEPITPTRLRRARTARNRARELHVLALRAFLEARTAMRQYPRGQAPGHIRLAFEEAQGDRWSAQHFHRQYQRRLDELLTRTVEKGAHVSPAAKARLIARGIWRAE